MQASENRFYLVNDIEEENHLKSTRALAAYICKVPGSFILLSARATDYLRSNTATKKFKSFALPDFFNQLKKDSILEIADSDLDSRFSENELFREVCGVRFFAAAALTSKNGESIGYLTIHADQPAVLDEGQKEAFQIVAGQLAHYLETHINKFEGEDRKDPLGKELVLQQQEAEYGFEQLWVAKNLDQGVVISDIDGRIIWVNAAFTNLTGYTLDEISGKRTGDMISGQDTNIRAIKNAREKSAGDQAFVVELQAYQKTGKPYWVSVSGSVVLDRSGKAYRIIEILSDITERKNKNLELETLSMAVKNSSGGISVRDKQGRLIWMNEALENILGYKQAELEGNDLNSFLQVSAHQTKEETLENIKKDIEERKPYEAELEIITKDKKKIWVLVKTNYILDKRNQLERIVSLIVDITARKEAELNLVRFSNVVNQSTNAIIIWDLNGRITSVNDAGQQIFGYTTAEYLGMHYYDFLSGPETDQTVLKGLISKIRSGANASFDLTFYKKDGTPVSVIGSLKPIVNQNGEIESSALILTDVTELKKAEREIKRLSLVATESPNGILIRDATGRPVWVNEAFEKTSGYSLDELVTKNIDELFIGPDTDIQTLSEAVRNREKGEKVSTELLLYQKSGTPVWIQLLTYQILNERGQMESSVTIINDITEQKKKDEEFRMLSLVASKTVTGVIINDEKGKVYWCNPSFEKITGYSILDLKDQRLGDVIKGSGTDLQELKAVRDIEKQNRSFYTEMLSYKKDGTAFWMAVSSSPVVDEDGRMIHVIDIIDDITERKEAEFQLIKTKDEALHLSKAKEMFLSVMSHEIRTPLNSVNAITQLLLDGNPTEVQIEYLSLLKFSGENLSTLINDILDLTKMETGNLTLEKATVNLHELVKNTIYSLQVKADENKTKLHLNIEPAVPIEIVGDSVRLYQILMNLAGNSIKFTKNGEVTISLELLNETASTVLIGFSIADTGIGIPEDKLESIFEAYTQASSDTTRKFGGTGLGLTITKNLLNIHGSEIHVSSKPGEGSTFTFHIEFDKVDSSPASKPDHIELSTSPILVVDDNAINRKIAHKVLAELYAEIHFAENGEMALEKVKTTIYDCVLMDIFMPVMDGIEAAARIRSLDGEYFKMLPIIALTGSTDPKDLESIHQCGMNGHIVKPLSKQILLEKISKYRRSAYAQFPF